jgi:hypothetical protein
MGAEASMSLYCHTNSLTTSTLTFPNKCRTTSSPRFTQRCERLLFEQSSLFIFSSALSVRANKFNTGTKQKVCVSKRYVLAKGMCWQKVCVSKRYVLAKDVLAKDMLAKGMC